jgi:hypothetical protein
MSLSPILFGSKADGAYPYGSIASAAAASPSGAISNITNHYLAMYDSHFSASLSALSGGMGPLKGDGYIVSEGIGYWMLLSAVMHGVTMGSNASGPRKTPQQQFDGCLTTALARGCNQYARDNPADPYGAESAAYLMAWRIKADGSYDTTGNTQNPNDAYSAPDGDLDIALALLMANRQWGSAGTYNYADLASKWITALKHRHFRSDGTIKSLPKPGGYGSDPTPFTMVRTSDFMFNHFRAFARATQDPFWLGQTTTTEGKGAAYDRCYWLANYIQTQSYNTSGLLPDWIENTETSTPIPAQDLPGHGDPSLPNRGKYWDSNACRNQWRFVTEYVFSGNSNVKTVVDRMNTFFKNLLVANANSPSVIKDQYALNGTLGPNAASSNFAEVMGSVMAGMISDATYSTQLDKLWLWNTAAGGLGGWQEAGYYSGEIQLMSKIVAAGFWWEPAPNGAIPGTPAPTPAPSPAPTPAPSSGGGGRRSTGQPTAYSKTANFAQDEASNVGGRGSVRTGKLDTEFRNIETTLNETLNNLALIQRDDGKLRDGVVELFTLSATARAALQGQVKQRGYWSASAAYAINDVVQVDSVDYYCIVAHTSGAFATDLAAGYWLLTAGGSAEIAAVQANIATIKANEASASATLAQTAAASVAGAAGFRNKIINGNFQINQRQVASTSTVYGAGWYAMDRWQAGASGCTMSFSTTGNVVTVTITAGTLLQVIEGVNLRAGAHVLSWAGTAQGRINGGTYGASGLTHTATGGSNVTVEFGVGTLSFVQFEQGSTPSTFEERLYVAELALCHRYFRKLGQHKACLTPSFATTLRLPYHSQAMRAAPTVTLGTLSTSTNASSISLTLSADGGGYWEWSASAGGVSLWTVDFLVLSAEL